MSVDIVAQSISEARAWTVVPLFATIRFGVSGSVDTVVVHNILFCLQISFPWCVYDSSRIFQHRYEIRKDDRLGEEILASAEQRRTLPLPLSFLRVIIAAMRGPHYQMTVIKSMGNTEGARCIADPRQAVVMDLPPKRIAGQRGKVCVIVLQGQSRNDDAEVVVAVNLWKQMSNFLVDFANLLIVEFLLSEGRVWYDGNLPLLIVDAQLLESRLTGKVSLFCLI